MESHNTQEVNSSRDGHLIFIKKKFLKGHNGLYMNFSIIFALISVYPETSILLQIIRMTFRIMPEYNR